MSIWFIVSFGFGILWSDELDLIRIGGFKLGFWFAQQGSIFIFVILIFVYVHLMNRLDKKYKKIIEQKIDKIEHSRTYLSFVGLSFALYIGIAICSRAGSTSDFYVAGKV